MIRKKPTDTVLVDGKFDGLLSKHKTLTVLVRVSNRGKIQVHVKYDHTTFQSIAAVTDANVLNVKYFSFASFATNPLQVFHSCQLDTPAIDQQIMQDNKKSHELFNDPIVPDKKNGLLWLSHPA